MVCVCVCVCHAYVYVLVNMCMCIQLNVPFTTSANGQGLTCAPALATPLCPGSMHCNMHLCYVNAGLKCVCVCGGGGGTAQVPPRIHIYSCLIPMHPVLKERIHTIFALLFQIWHIYIYVIIIIIIIQDIKNILSEKVGGV